MKIIGVKKFRTYFYIYKCVPVLNRSNISLQIHLFKKVHIKLKLKLSYSYIYSCLFCWFSIIFFLPAVLHFRIHPFRLYYYKICLNISSRSWDMHPLEYLIYTYFYTMTCEHRNGCCTSMRTWSLVCNITFQYIDTTSLLYQCFLKKKKRVFRVHTNICTRLLFTNEINLNGKLRRRIFSSCQKDSITLLHFINIFM